MKEVSLYIIEHLQSLSDEKKAAWLEKYVKHEIRSRGVGIPAIRQIVVEAEQKFGISGKPLHHQETLLNLLMSELFTEDKLAAIIFMQLYWKDVNPQVTLKLVSTWFERDYIFDWNICDWLCVRLLTPILERFPDLAIKEFRGWNESGNLWKARASLVPFAQSGNLSVFRETVDEFSSRLIRREERFCKTAVGWVMREFSRKDSEFVMEFLGRHENEVTAEVRKNATKYLKTTG